MVDIKDTVSKESPEKWPSTGPGRIYCYSRKKFNDKPLFVYIDRLIRELPGYSNKALVNLHTPLPSLGHFESAVEHLRLPEFWKKVPRFVILLADEKSGQNKSEDYLPQLTASLCESRNNSQKSVTAGLSAAVLVDDDGDAKLKLNSGLHIRTKVKRESNIYKGTNSIHYKDCKEAKVTEEETEDRNGKPILSTHVEIPSSYWPRLNFLTLEFGLQDLTQYLIKLGCDLGLMQKESIRNIDIPDFVKKIINAVDKNDPGAIKPKTITRSFILGQKLDPALQAHQDKLVRHIQSSILTNGAVTDDDGNLLFYFAQAAPTAQTKDSPGSERLIDPGKPKLIRASLAVREDLSFLGGTIDGVKVTKYPSSKYIQTIIAKPEIETMADLRRVWFSLGIKVANVEQEKEHAIKILDDNWASIEKGTGVLRRLDPKTQKYKYYFSFARNSSVAKPWGNINGIEIEKFPNQDFIKRACGKEVIRSQADLKTVWKALGLDIAKDTEEAKDLPKILIEENIETILKNTNIFKLPGRDGKLKYYFGFCNGSLKWGKVSDHGTLQYFPNASIIKQILKTNQNRINTPTELKKMWDSFGMPVATQEEEADLPRLLLEANWDRVHSKTRVHRFLDNDGKYTYYFSQAIGNNTKWGKVADNLNGVKKYPSKTFLLKHIKKDCISSVDNLKTIWEAMGLRVASPAQEKKLPKKLIEANWQAISNATGIIKMESPSDKREKYFFSFVKAPGNLGLVPGSGMNYQSFPDNDFIEAAIGQRLITNKLNWRKVWHKMGMEVANEREEQILPKILIENNWDAVSAATGVSREKVGDDYIYKFDSVKPHKDWGKFYGLNLVHFPGINTIKAVLGSNRAEIASPSDLKRVWTHLGLQCA